MFLEEAIWVGKMLDSIGPAKNRKVANIGSSTGHFRKIVQPHIHISIFDPLEKRDFIIQHIDAKKDEGVDIIEDITQPSFATKYANNFQVVICTNMLEHVENIHAVIENLYACCMNDGFILITVPYKYKKHEDPIDNMYRPLPSEIFSLFEHGKVIEVESKVIVIQQKKYYSKKKSHFPFWGYREIVNYHIGRKHKVSGILLKVVK